MRTHRWRPFPDVQAFQRGVQIGIHNMGVDHGRTQVRMPEGLLDQANILRLPIELCGTRVLQHMGVHILVAQAGFPPPPLHHRPQGRAIDGRAFARGKEQASGAGGAAGPPAAQVFQERFVEPEDAVFLAFPLPDGELTAQPVDIVDGQRQDLGGAHAGMEHELHETAIAVAGEVARIGACQQGGDLRAGEHGREAARTGHRTIPFLGKGPWGHS